MLLSSKFLSSHSRQATPTSPIRVKVEPSHDASKVKAEGPGLSRTGKDDHPLERLWTSREIGAKYPYMVTLSP